MTKTLLVYIKLPPCWGCQRRFPIACLPLEKTSASLKEETNRIGEPDRWSQEITLPQARMLFCTKTRCDFSHNLAPCLQPTYLKTHDCNTEILLSILPCTLKHNYARLYIVCHTVCKKWNINWRLKRILYYRFYTINKSRLPEIALIWWLIFIPFVNYLDLASSIK